MHGYGLLHDSGTQLVQSGEIFFPIQYMRCCARFFVSESESDGQSAECNAVDDGLDVHRGCQLIKEFVGGAAIWTRPL